MDASQVLAKLQTERSQAAAHLDEADRRAREAGLAVQEAATALAEGERQGLSATKRHALEEALDAARRAADQQLWQARISGAQQAVRDCDLKIRAHTTEHLAELIAEKEAAGEVAAQRVNEAASELVAAWMQCEQVRAEIGQLASRVARLDPHDVSRSVAEACAQAATSLASQGGEVAPSLDRQREPWATLLSQPAPEAPEAVSA